MIQEVKTSIIYEYLQDSDKRITVFQGGSRCFAGDQLVITSEGSKPISEVKAGDIVLSFNELNGKDEFKKVKDTFSYKNTKKTIRIKLKNGTQIVCTEDHKFYFEGIWICGKDLLSLLNARNMERNTGI